MLTLITITRIVMARVGLGLRGVRIAGGLLALVAGVCGGGCATPEKDFATPELAVESLMTALRTGNEKELRTILGSEGDELIGSGDPVADANNRAEFMRLYDERHQLVTEDGVARLEVGASAWPMPIPVVQGNKGWYFDASAGADELLSRRIGRNELAAIQVCMAIYDAQREYVAMDRNADGLLAYATKFASDEGTKNGLYWPTKEGEPPSPLGELAARASTEGYAIQGSTREPRPFHGYYFRILTAQGTAAPGGAFDYIVKGEMIGGFGVIAWPAEYGRSGLKSFMVSHAGVVYEKDLGDETDGIARRMKAFDPGPGWEPCASAMGN